LSNAAKFTEQGYITLYCKETILPNSEYSKIEFKISDTGIGISKESLHLLFHPFVQADASTTRKFGGTGLGLVIARQLIKIMKGDVNITSEQNVGTTVEFYILLRRVDKMVIEQHSDKFSKGKSLDVLVAEDNAMIQILIKKMLESLSHNCDIVSNGEAALQCALKKHYDIIFLDLMMPVMSGTEAAKRMKNIPLNSNTPIIALTASVDVESRKGVSDAGMIDFLSKPVTRLQIADMLHKHTLKKFM